MQNTLKVQESSWVSIQRLALVYFMIPFAFSVLFGWHRTAIPADFPRLYSIVAWTCILVPTWIAYDAACWTAAKLCAPRKPPLWLLLTAAALVASALINPALVWISEFVFHIDVPPMPSSLGGAIVTFLLNAAPFIALWVAVNLILVHQVGLARFGYSCAPAPLRTKTKADHRLPAHEGEILAISAEDHYVRFHFANKSELVRMKFNDALDAMTAKKGLRVHRSYWVSLDAISNVEQTGRQCILILTGGLRIPVSRSYRVKLAEEGLL